MLSVACRCCIRSWPQAIKYNAAMMMRRMAKMTAIIVWWWGWLHILHCDLTKCMIYDKLQQCITMPCVQSLAMIVSWTSTLHSRIPGPRQRFCCCTWSHLISRPRSSQSSGHDLWAKDTFHSEPVTMTNNLRFPRCVATFWWCTTMMAVRGICCWR